MGQAAAQTVTLKPIVDTRIRYEGVQQDGLSNDADAITARVRAGMQADSGPFSLLIEAEGLLAIADSYNSGTNGKTAFPLVVDPQNIELNRAQIQFRGVPKTLVTVGRQRINLDDQRFVGAVAWRQNEQSFDAVRGEWTGVPNLKVDAAYAWSIRTINGIDGIGVRPQAIGGSDVFINVSYKFKPLTVVGFAYLIDEHNQLLRANSSQTYGARATGAVPIAKATKLTYSGSYARQSDHGRNPNGYRANYYLGELGIEHKALRLLAGYEVLGADDGRTQTSFQTPLATLHKFQGFADKFLVTPPNGIRDKYATAGLVIPKLGKLAPITFYATYHWFDSDRLNIKYGEELNLVGTIKIGRTLFLAKYADYYAASFATDTKKFWLSAEWAI
jgi:hypothetical protein